MKKPIAVLTLCLGLTSCGDGHAEEQQTSDEPITVDNICELAWTQNEEQLDAADRLGNPFVMRSRPDQPWRFTVEYEGHSLLVIPARMLNFQVELTGEQTASGRAQTIDCEVPLAWKALDSRLQVSFDPLFQNSKKITMINGKPFGHEARGGIYVRYNLIPNDPHDINLAWHLAAPEMNAEAVRQLIRQVLHMPMEQELELLRATDLLQKRGNMPLEGLAMTLGAASIKQWALPPAQAATLFPQLSLLPLGAASAEKTVEDAWNKARILDLAALKLWDVPQRQWTACTAVGTGPHPSCRQIVDDSLLKIFKEAQGTGRELCVHLAWKAEDFSPYVISRFCVDQEGQVQFQGSSPATDPGFVAANQPARGR